jgi:hypothetical protein
MSEDDDFKDRWLLAQIKRPRKTQEAEDKEYIRMFMEGR